MEWNDAAWVNMAKEKGAMSCFEPSASVKFCLSFVKSGADAAPFIR